VFALFLLCVSLDTTFASLGKFKVKRIYKVAPKKSREVARLEAIKLIDSLFKVVLCNKAKLFF
jgi:hypothetical protein